MKRVIVYTTIGTVLIVLGVYFSPSKASASEKSSDEVAVVNISSIEKLTEIVSVETKEDKDVLRVSTILKAMEEGKVTERQAEILNYMEDLLPLEDGNTLFPTLNSLFLVSKEEFTELKNVMNDISLDISLYL